jgi:YD repeat-containing protein
LGTTTKEQYTYDAAGNRLTGPVSTVNSIGTDNQLVSSTTASYVYDNNGNLTSKSEGGSSYAFTYNGDNQLEQVVKTTGSTVVTTSFKYDPFGNRIEKTVNGITTKYLNDGTNILYEYDGSSAITARYTYNLAIDDPLGLEKGGKLYAFHKDTLGSITAITDSTQAVINTYTYDSFGNTTQTGTLSQPYSYTGRELDKETGLYYILLSGEVL